MNADHSGFDVWLLRFMAPFHPRNLLVRQWRVARSRGAQHPRPAEGKVAEELTRLLMDQLQRAGQVPWQDPNKAPD